MTDPKTLKNSAKVDYWAKNFLERMKKLTETDEKEVTVVLGDTKRRYRKCVIYRKNLEYALGYGDHLMSIGFKLKTSAIVVNKLIYFFEKVRKPGMEMKREDIEKFVREWSMKYSTSYTLDIQRRIKPFFRWLYGMTPKDGYPEVVDWISCKRKNDGQLPIILTMEEIQKMIKTCDNLRDRAIVSVCYESGCRASEILDAKIGDLAFDEYGAIFTTPAMMKTGSRHIRLVSCVPDIKTWLNVHMYGDSKAPLFYAITCNNKGNPLGDSSLHYIVSQIAKRAGIEKRVYPHLFRHTRATHLSKVMSDQEMRLFFGWTRQSNMPSYYSHLSGKDVDDKILILNGIKPAENDKAPVILTVKCYKCGEFNGMENRFCWKCNTPLKQDSIDKVEKVRKMVSEITMEIFEKMKDGKIGENDLELVVKNWYNRK